MHCVIVGLNIKSAPIDALEELSIHHSQIKTLDQEVKAATDVDGIVILNTCNRLEFYATCDDADEGRARIRAFLHARAEKGARLDAATLDKLLYSYADDIAIRHLFEVVCGLDSLILGEAEILGQVNRAYKAACEAHATDKLINVWFQRALHFGKKVRTKTDLGKHPVSIGHIAVDFALARLGATEGKRALIIGAGEVGELTAKYLLAYEFPVVMVANRSLCKARELAEQHGLEACDLSRLEDHLALADVVFAATSAKRFIIKSDLVERVMSARPSRPLLLVDMALPRDVDPAVARIEGVSLRNINELRDMSERNRMERELAAKGVRQLIEEELADFRLWMQSLALVPVITAFRKHADDIKASRLAAALEKLPDLTPSQAHTVDVLATTITNQFVRNPIEMLRAHAASTKASDYADMLQELFCLDLDATQDATHAASDCESKRAV